MKLQQLRKKAEGFTIIEVLIVLAIAGLILLIVFLAVPALQRNARNTSARNEAASVLAAVNEFITNNNGQLPAASDSGTPNSDAAKVWASLKAQTLTSVLVEGGGSPWSAGSTVPTASKAIVVRNSKCAKTTGNVATDRANMVSSGTGRQFAVVYLTETGSGDQLTCNEG